VQKVIAGTLLLALAAAEAGAQEGEGRVLPVGRVNYWGTAPKAAEPRESPPAQAQAASLWAEPIRLPDGRYVTYTPPAQVLAFLEDPTPAAAKHYLEWQKERMSKLRKAMEMLAQVSREEDASSPSKEPAGNEMRLLYFKQAQCAFCGVQDQILARVKRAFPKLAIDEIERGASPETWEKHGVDVTPTIVLARGGETIRKFRGLAPLDEIEKVLKEAADAKR